MALSPLRPAVVTLSVCLSLLGASAAFAGLDASDAPAVPPWQAAAGLAWIATMGALMAHGRVHRRRPGARRKPAPGDASGVPPISKRP